IALVTTFATTPLTATLYPVWYQKKLESWKRGEIDWDGNPLTSEHDGSDDLSTRPKALQIQKLLVYLRLDSLPSLFTFIALLGNNSASKTVRKVHRLKTAELGIAGEETEAAKAAYSSAAASNQRQLEVHGLRILELTERT